MKDLVQRLKSAKIDENVCRTYESSSAQCIARRAQHLDLTLVELLTLSLAVLNGVMYFLWWNKPMDVRFPIRVYLLDKSYTPTGDMSGKTESDVDRFGEFQVY